MAVDKILAEWKKSKFKPVYWLEGEEEYFIDQIMSYAEHNILSEQEASFNLTVFYGKDAEWPAVINACRRYPMFSERQVVLLKEAQQMRDIEKLEPYIEHPLDSTILVISYKDKKVDGRTKLSRLLKQKGEIFSSKKLFDNQLPDWANHLVETRGYTIAPKALQMLVDHIGNDLNRLSNEIDKVLLNLVNRKQITEDDIETFVGVSKEYNAFELQGAVAIKDLAKALRIIQYYEANPKAAPIQLVLPSLYNFFSKAYMLFGMQDIDNRQAASALGINPYFFEDYREAAKNYSFRGIEQVLLLLHHYNLKSVGIGDIGTPDGSLLKEMVVKMMSA